MSLVTPNVQPRNQFPRDWGDYATPDLLPNCSGFTAPANKLVPLEAGDTAYVTNRGRWYCESAGTPGAGDAIWRSGLVTMTVQEVTRTIVVAGQQAVFLPWGQYVLAQSGWAEVTLNGAPLTFGVDWIFQTRQARSTGWGYPSTADASTGVWLLVSTNAGDVVVVRWRTGRINLPPPSVSPVYVTGGALPPSPGVGLTQRWTYVGAVLPNAIVCPGLDGFQLEVWRMSRKSGRVVGVRVLPGLDEYRRGRNFVPLFRPASATSGDILIQPGADFSAPTNRSHYRVCYYDPATGARTDLSAEHVVFENRRDDRISTLGVVHQRGSVWTVSG